MEDFVYESPPLVEVIAEIHWHIEKLSTVPGGGLDPQFAALMAGLEKVLPEAGFGTIERLVPAELPIELLADKPVVRFWRAANQWPLFQVGPGVMTVNIVPPYEGWNQFKPNVQLGLDVLRKHYPVAEKLLHVERAELRYIDGFTKRHGFTTYEQFVRDNLAIRISLPDGVTRSTPQPANEHVACSADFRFPLAGKPNNWGVIRIRPGKIRNEPGAIAEFAVQWRQASGDIPLGDLASWFDAAHSSVRDWFSAMVNESLKTTFGAQRKVGT